MPPEAAQKPTDTRQHVISVAETLFAQQGFHGTTLDDVANTVGIRRPSVIYHFRDKQTLYEEVLKALFNRQSDFFNTLREERQPPEQQLYRLLDRWLDYAVMEPNYLQIFLHHLAGGFKAENTFWKLARPMVRLWESTLSAGRRQGVFQKVELIHILSIVVGATAYYVIMSGKDLKQGNSESLATFRQNIHNTVKQIVAAEIVTVE